MNNEQPIEMSVKELRGGIQGLKDDLAILMENEKIIAERKNG